MMLYEQHQHNLKDESALEAWQPCVYVYMTRRLNESDRPTELIELICKLHNCCLFDAGSKPKAMQLCTTGESLELNHRK